MARLEDLKPNTSVRGILPNGLVTVVSVQWHGSAAIELTYKTPEGRVANELLYRHAAGNGASIFKMMDVSRHKSVDTLRGYVRDAELFKDHAGTGLL